MRVVSETGRIETAGLLTNDSSAGIESRASSTACGTQHGKGSGSALVGGLARPAVNRKSFHCRGYAERISRITESNRARLCGCHLVPAGRGEAGTRNDGSLNTPARIG